MKRFLIGVIALTFCIAAAHGQDLAKLDKQTREQKMKTMQQQSVRIWNNDNMPRRPAGEGPTAAAGMSPTVAQPIPEPSPELPPALADNSDLDSLQGQIKQSRQGLKDAEERLRLAEDELNLLKVQQASELAPETQATLATRVKDKDAEVTNLRRDIDKAKKDIEKLEKDFKAQGGKLDEKK